MAKTKVESEEEIKDDGSKTILDIIQENIETYSKYFNKNTKDGEEPEMYPLIIFDTYEDFVEYKKYDKRGTSGVGMELLNSLFISAQELQPMTWEEFLTMVFHYGYITSCKNCWNSFEGLGCVLCEDCLNCVDCQNSKNCKDCGNTILNGASPKAGVENSNNCINCFICKYCNNCLKCLSCNYCDNCLDCYECKYSKQCIGCEDCNKSDDKYCINCQYCNGCLGCSDCIKCSNECTTCEKCGGCSGCESCIKCRNCVNCTGCEECIGCNSCVTCYDCDDSNELESQAHMYKTWEKDLNDNYLRDYFYFVN